MGSFQNLDWEPEAAVRVRSTGGLLLSLVCNCGGLHWVILKVLSRSETLCFHDSISKYSPLPRKLIMPGDSPVVTAPFCVLLGSESLWAAPWHETSFLWDHQLQISLEIAGQEHFKECGCYKRKHQNLSRGE